MDRATDDERLDDLEGWRRQVEQRYELTTVVEFVGQLMDDAAYKARYLSGQSRRWRVWKIRFAVLGACVGIIASTVNAVQSFH